MNKLTLAILLATVGISSAQAATTVELAKGRLIFTGALNQSGCTVTNAVDGGGDINIPMPGSLGVTKVKALTAATSAGWSSLDEDVKYSKAKLPFALNIECPTDDIYAYVDGITGVKDDAKANFSTKAKLYFYGQDNGASGFIPTTDSGSVVGLLAADKNSSNRSVGIAVKQIDSKKGDKVIDLDPANSADGVAIDVNWVAGTKSITAQPTFDFAYVPASSKASVGGGVTTATMPFKFEYR
ncbi:hypothetical protein CD201_06325 [Hafnia alvei]|uniref:hypothetical protein n=1 Tax=Hafnia TaxID=568 RepID=UPI000BBB1BFB|nr:MULTISPECIES: hypothetical protein [Hafnia]AWV44214.1 hypothetical protein CD201_06325 [Hafnia alvei]TBL89942.1 hypothetical protein EYY95_06130 [Hafnia alvei]